MNNIFHSYKKTNCKNIYLDLFYYLKKEIENGNLKGKLPTIRATSAFLNLSANTIAKSYLELEKNKYVESKVGSGFFICYSSIFDDVNHLNFENEDTLLKHYSEEIKFDLVSTSPNISFLPVKDIQNSINFVLDKYKEKALIQCGPLGSKILRTSIKKNLLNYKINIPLDNIHILSGAQQGIDLLSKTLIFPGDIVVVEKPTYLGALNAFKKSGAKIKEIPILNDGLCISSLIEILKKHKIKFLYLMSNFQTPTGVSISYNKKIELLALAKKYSFYILEDDSSADLFYSETHPFPLKSLDKNNQIIYIKSFSKIFMPGFRLGFCIIPTSLLTNFLNFKKLINLNLSTLYQQAFAHLLDEHLVEKQMMLSREKYKKIQSTLINELKLINNITYTIPKGGLSLWIKLPKDISSKAVYTKLLKNNMIIVPGYIYSESFDEYIKINYGQIKKNKIKESIKLLNIAISELQFLNI